MKSIALAVLSKEELQQQIEFYKDRYKQQLLASRLENPAFRQTVV